MMKRFLVSLALAFLVFLTAYSGVLAQQQEAVGTAGVSVSESAPPSAENSEAPVSSEPVFSDEAYPSLVFTYWEHVAIKDARNSRGLVRPPSESELARDLKSGEDTSKPKPPPEQREIRLGGLVYHGKKDWVIWLNEKRVTPDALPVEVLDLNVYKEYVEMKWFDEWSNQIYPIRLRPHQRFNIDTRIFLPGN